MILKGLKFLLSYEQKYALNFLFGVYFYYCVYLIRCPSDMASKKMMKKQMITSYEKYCVFLFKFVLLLIESLKFVGNICCNFGSMYI